VPDIHGYRIEAPYNAMAASAAAAPTTPMATFVFAAILPLLVVVADVLRAEATMLDADATAEEFGLLLTAAQIWGASCVTLLTSPLEHDPRAMQGPMLVAKLEELEHRHLKSAALQPMLRAALWRHGSAQGGSWATSPGRSDEDDVEDGNAVMEVRVGVANVVDCADASATKAAAANALVCMFSGPLRFDAVIFPPNMHQFLRFPRDPNLRDQRPPSRNGKSRNKRPGPNEQRRQEKEDRKKCRRKDRTKRR